MTCADVPNAQIGSNFLMKLDPRTLPAGYALTTENPRDVRLTRGKITKLNFGASKRRDVALDLTKDAFRQRPDLKPKFASGMDRLVSLLQQGKGHSPSPIAAVPMRRLPMNVSKPSKNCSRPNGNKRAETSP